MGQQNIEGRGIHKKNPIFDLKKKVDILVIYQPPHILLKVRAKIQSFQFCCSISSSTADLCKPDWSK